MPLILLIQPSKFQDVRRKHFTFSIDAHKQVAFFSQENCKVPANSQISQILTQKMGAPGDETKP